MQCRRPASSLRYVSRKAIIDGRESDAKTVLRAETSARYSGAMELPAAVEATSFADSAVEAAYQEARTRFVAARPTASGGAWLVVSLVAFAAIELAQSGSIAKLILLVAVLLFHELGH